MLNCEINFGLIAYQTAYENAYPLLTAALIVCLQ